MGGGPHLCLFGASDDTGNLGVSALMTGTLIGLTERCPRAHITVFDHGLGRRSGVVSNGTDAVAFEKLGARVGHRYHRGENLRTMAVAARFGGLANRGARTVIGADAVLDLSGGDSFTDLYGPRRFDQVVRPKWLALQTGTPLVLLPQTYGPFHSERSRAAAVEILRRATLAYARGADGFAAMQDLLGADFDPQRHRQGVDVALTMPPRRSAAVAHLLSSLRSDDRPLVGINISGLLFEQDPKPYGLSVAYGAAMVALVRRLIAQTDVRVVLVPHVTGAGESDTAACARVAEVVDEPDRVVVGPSRLDAQETKWLISQTEWFCGTRMHATIAALSTGTPVAAVAYSHKTREVFATCDIPDEVADARSLTTEELTDQLVASYAGRHMVAARLASARPLLRDAAAAQLDHIVSTIDSAAAPLAARSRP